MQVSASSSAQLVTLKENNINLRQAFDQIRRQTGLIVLYKSEMVKKTVVVDLDLQRVPIEEALKVILRDQNLNFEIKKKSIILSPKIDPLRRQTLIEEVKDIDVRGKVTDGTGKVIPGATVKVKGSAKITVTDEKGEFHIEGVADQVILEVSYIGYKTIEISVKNQDYLNLKLEEDIAGLSQVVVVGYGTQKKVNLTGAVEVIDGARLKNRPTNNVTQAIQGTVSGVRFSYGNSGFEPGAAPTMQIRGQGSPYVIIDGAAGDINTIDPNDVENISVLKDAAASAIYGARAPYGVLIITTKSGKQNQGIQVDASVNSSTTTIINKPKMVDSYSFVRAMNEMHDNQGEARLYSETTINRIIARINDPSLPEAVPDPNNPTKWATYQLSSSNNDWIDIHFGSGRRNQENVSIKGGGKEAAYFISLGHAYEKGIFKMAEDNYNRINLNAKVDLNINKWWKLSSNMRFVSEDRINPVYNGEGDYGMVIHHIFRTHPTQFLKSPNGYYSALSRVELMRTGSENAIRRDLFQRLATEITPLKGLSINADYAVSLPTSQFLGKNLTAYEDQVDGILTPIASTVPSYITKSKSNSVYQSLNLFSSYKLDLAKSHHFEFLAGYQQESNQYDYLSGLKRELITPEVPSITTATGEMQVADDLSHWATQGFFTRFNYNYLDRYLLEANARYDGTSKFADHHRWGWFPSISGRWNVSNEKFWEKISRYVSTLSFRGSWGSLGNQNVAAYQDLALLGVQPNLGWIINSKRPSYTTAPNLINPNLTWETSKTIDFGIDMGVLNNRLKLVFDYYQRLTYNRLGPAQALPVVLGTAIPQENNSELRTRGWDASLTWQDKIGKDFNYSITGMLFDYNSVVTKYRNPTGILTTDYIGKQVGEIWGYETIGLIQTQERANFINTSKMQNFINAQIWRKGDVEYADLNGDGLVNTGKNTVNDHGDYKVIGNTTPRYQFGLNLTASYKNFDFSVFVQGTAKRDLWLTGNVFWGFNSWNQTSLFPHHLDYYRDAESSKYSGLGPNTEAYFPRPYSAAAQYSKNQQVQTRYLQNAAYLRLKNLQIGYTLPKNIADKIGLKRTRLYFSGENILTWTKIPRGFDPETANVGELGNGKTIFSQAIWAGGINVSF